MHSKPFSNYVLIVLGIKGIKNKFNLQIQVAKIQLIIISKQLHGGAVAHVRGSFWQPGQKKSEQPKIA